MSKDDIYAQKLDKVTDFIFDERVARVFPDMVKRSVPGYDNIVQLIGVLARQYAKNDSNIYDLGTSLGACLFSMMQRVTAKNIQYIGVDNSEQMLNRCHTVLEPFMENYDLQLRCEDIADSDIRNASVVVMNFTLQFVPRDKRNKIIETIYQGLQPGGILILSEKMQSDEKAQAYLESWHEGYKRDQGYSDLEISQKREALENVMKLDDEAGHIARLKCAGFDNVVRSFQYLQFATLVAIK